MPRAAADLRWPLDRGRIAPVALLVLAFGLEVLAVVAVRRGGNMGTAAVLALVVIGFAVVSLTVDVIPTRWEAGAFAALGLILTPALVHVAVDGGRQMTLVAELAGFALALIVLTPRPAATFAGWLLLAPLFQLAARSNPAGYYANNALYLAPPLLLALWTLTPRSGLRRRSARPIDVLPLAYLLLALTSLAFSSWAAKAGYRSSINQLYQNSGIGVIGYYFCAFGPVRGRLGHHFATGLLGGGFVVAVLAIVERATRWTLWGDQSTDTEFRATATLSSPGVLGAFLGASIAVATAILLWHGPRSLRRLSLALLPVAVPALGFTLTRGPILATLVVVGTMIAARRSGARWVWAGVAVLAAGVIVLQWGAITSSSLYHNRVAEKGNVQGRLLIDQWSIKLFERRPVAGYGYGSFNEVKNAAQLSPGNLPLAAGRDYTSHNTFLTILVELGAVGLALLALPWLKIPYDALKAVARRPVPDVWLAVGCAGIVGTYVLTGLTTDMRFFSIVPALTWIAVGLLRGQLAAGADRTAAAAATPAARRG